MVDASSLLEHYESPYRTRDQKQCIVDPIDGTDRVGIASHNLMVIHKDVKLDNMVLLDQEVDHVRPHAVLIDFGLAELFMPPASRGDRNNCRDAF